LIYSTRTSCRSARKQQRKMWNLKKGNFREEPTIIFTLKQIIEKLENYIGYLLKLKYFYLKKMAHGHLLCLSYKRTIWQILRSQ